MTREQAIAFIRGYIRQHDGPFRVLAAKRGCTVPAISKAVSDLAPWMLQEVGLKKVKVVTFEPVSTMDSNCAQTPTIRP